MRNILPSPALLHAMIRTMVLPILPAVVKNILRPFYRRCFRKNTLQAPQTVKDPKFPQLVRAMLQFDNLNEVSDSTKRMWIDFALSTNERGRVVTDELERYVAIRGKKCVDIGCAYGGFLVAFATKGAAQVVGVDINADFLRLAAANLEDFHVSACLRQGDLLDPEILKLGRFDVITCNDVIEHVEDPRKAIRHLSLLLEDGGVLYMEIPNRYFIGFIREDGHYKLPGITLLPRQRAAHYHYLNFGDGYGVGYYRKLDYYLRLLARQGLSPILINQDVGLFAPHQLDNMFRQALQALQSFEKRRIEPALAEEIRTKAAKIYEIFTREVQTYQTLSRQHPERAMSLAQRIHYRYGLDFWKIVAFKRSTAE